MAEETARGIIKPFCDGVTETLIKGRFYLDPRSKRSKNLKILPLPAIRGLYVIVDKDGNILKVGYARNLAQRWNYYDDEENIRLPKDKRLESWQFVVISYLDKIDEPTHAGCQVQYDLMMQALISCPDLDPFQVSFFKAMYEEQGDRLGLKSIMWLQMAEYGFMRHFGVHGNAAEFAMFSPKVSESLYSAAKSDAAEILQYLGVILRLVKSGMPVPMQAINSWMSGVKHLSSKITTIECIL
ncbi:MAG: hypothetical protein SGARI_000832, partial [Bacillariaceae sp.]